MITQQNIHHSYERIISLLDKKELKNAFGFLQGLLSQVEDMDCQDKLDEVQETYRYMLRYRMEGVNDPMHTRIYHDILTSAYELADTLKLRLLSACEGVPLYYTLRKKMESMPDIPTGEMQRQLLDACAKQDRKYYEGTLFVLFNKIWLTGQLQEAESRSISKILSNGQLPYPVGCQVVSALTLSSLTYFDPGKLLLLLQATDKASNEEISVRAFIGALLILYMYRKRTYLYPKISDRLAAVAEQPGFTQKLRTVTMRFILAKETEKITRKIQDEIIPVMMKFVPDIKKINLGDFNSEMMAGENPEWRDLLKGSSFEKSIEEYNELQQEGADVMHSTFAYLKHYDFFREISNWFLPFTAGHSSLTGYREDESGRVILELTQSLIFLCNSDKYSFFLSMMKQSQNERSHIFGQFHNNTKEIMEQYQQDVIGEKGRFEIIAGQYIQDLYRFFKLHPSRKDFEDVFLWPLDFYNLPILAPYFSSPENISIIAEYYLKRNYFDEALSLFTRLKETDGRNDMLLQKTGYCLQMKGDIEGALDTYLQADLINAGSKWLSRRIAGCYRALNQPTLAMEYYRRLETMNPDNLSIQLSIGHCFLEQGAYSEALKYYFKVDYLDPGNGKAWRPIAWCLFLTGKFEQATNYYRKILQSGSPSMHDFMNAGHTAWVSKNLLETVTYYKCAVGLEENEDFNVFLEHFDKDIPHLLAAGVSEEEIPLVLDQVRYDLAES